MTLICTLAAMLLPAQETGKRVALVIGNDSYTIAPLKNAVNDARIMDAALKASGFQTILVENARKADLDRVVGEFLDKIGPDDTALFYYAGHGVQIEHENFLVPVDFTPGATISAAKFACMSMAQVFDELKRKRAKKNIVILDACRTNPVQSKYSLEGGLARPQDAPRETFIAFSTSPGQTAADNPDGHNSWFSESLAAYVAESSNKMELNEVLTRVKKRVSDATEGKQAPWTTSNMTAGFYFHLPAAGDLTDNTVIEKWITDAAAREQHGEWTEAAALIERVVQRKPGGAIEASARKRLAYLTARRDAQARYDAGDFAAAADLNKQALQSDSFAMSAALQSVNSFLLADRLPEAVELLQAMRARGNSEAVETANRMLKELGAASPEAAKAAQTPAPAPPGIDELFPDQRFGTIDGDAGKRFLASNPVDLSRWTRDLKMEPPVVVAAQPAAAPAAQPAMPDPSALIAPATTDSVPATDLVFHLEVVPTAETRNLRLRRTNSDDEFGTVEIDASGGNPPVVFEGAKLILPGKLKLPVGKYEIRSVEKGRVVDQQPVEVKAGTNQTIKVKR
jgi:hypothetical protein